MKLTKENVYIDLRGKSKEELTELYWLLKNNNEPLYRNSLDLFLKYPECYENLNFNLDQWCGTSSVMFLGKTEITIEQLKEILQPMENKQEQLRKEAKIRGYTHDNFKSLINTKSIGIEDIDEWYYCEFADTLYTNRYGNGGNVVYRKGVWAEIVSETLQQQLQKAEAKVKRLREAIEDSKIKVGDWCKFWNHDKSKFIIVKFQGNKFACIISGDYFLNCEKITNPQLIELLEQELIDKLN